MAKIIAGIATSHVPAVGHAVDSGRTQDDYWKPMFDGYEFSKQWVTDNPADVDIIVYNDHASYFGMDIMPTFALVSLRSTTFVTRVMALAPSPWLKVTPSWAPTWLRRSFSTTST